MKTKTTLSNKVDRFINYLKPCTLEYENTISHGVGLHSDVIWFDSFEEEDEDYSIQLKYTKEYFADLYDEDCNYQHTTDMGIIELDLLINESTYVLSKGQIHELLIKLK